MGVPRAVIPAVSGFHGLAFLRGGSEGMPERGRATGGDGAVALADLEGAIGGDAGDYLPGRDQVEQLGQRLRRFARPGGANRLDIADLAGGEIGRADFR
jgi:hypothetical protein